MDIVAFGWWILIYAICVSAAAREPFVVVHVNAAQPVRNKRRAGVRHKPGEIFVHQF
jgi:hypothetical protein